MSHFDSFWHKGHENYQPVHGTKVIYSIYCDTSRPFSPFFLGLSIISLHFIPGVLRKPIQGAWKHASDPKTKGQILEVSLRPREKLGNLMRKLGDFGPLHPGKLTWNTIMEVWFRWFSFSNRWFSGSMLIFWGFNRNQTESTEDGGLVTVLGGSGMGSSPKPIHLPRLHPWVFSLSSNLGDPYPKSNFVNSGTLIVKTRTTWKERSQSKKDGGNTYYIKFDCGWGIPNLRVCINIYVYIYIRTYVDTYSYIYSMFIHNTSSND